MMILFGRWFRVSGLLAVAATVSLATPAAERPEVIPPLPALPVFAARHGFQIEHFPPLATRGPGRPGDSVTILITLRDAHATKQWLTQLTMAEATAKELSDHHPRELILNASNGRVYRYAAGASLAIDIRTAGPFTADQTPGDEKRARTLISPDLLSIGLDESCRIMAALAAAKKKGAAAAEPDTPSHPSTTPPLPEDQERALFGCFPALAAFLEAIQATPGLREILLEALEKPSVWSIIRNRGLNLGLTFTNDSAAPVDPLPWIPTEFHIYRMSLPLTLNDKAALNCWLFVTAPNPPLLTTAGIVGIVATSPKHPSRRLDVQILAASRGAVR